jgi:hypothetical protein
MRKNYLDVKKILLGGLFLANGYGIMAQCTIPGSVTATPSVICAGSTVSLNATSVGSSINWYTVSTCGVPTGTSASGANFAVSPAMTTTYYAEAFSPAAAGGSMQLNYTGCMQQVVIPPGVNQVTIAAFGAQGVGMNGYLPGNGGMAAGILTVTPGQILYVYVGGQTGFNGGGAGQNGANGGDGSDVRVGGNTFANRVIVAGGGGGAGGDNWQCNVGAGHGGGGTAVGSNFFGGGGGAGYTSGTGCGTDGGNNGGTGGSGFHGGGGGGGGMISGGTGATSQVPGTAGTGSLGLGGASFNATGCNSESTGGGGGGYYGGGGAAGNNCGAGRGGGGSSWTGTLAFPTFSAGVQTGNGKVIIYGLNGGCVSVSRTPVTVTVNPSPTISIAGGTAAVCPGTAVTLTASGANTYTWSNGATTSTIAPTVTANVTYTAAGTASACIGQSVVNLSVQPTPTITVSGSTVICGTGTNVLTANGGLTYSWSTGATTSTVSVSPSVTTVYTVVGTGTMVGNCSGWTTETVVVSSNPSVSVTGGGTICAGQSATLMASGASTYSWNNGATTSSIVVSPTTTTSYTTIGTNSVGCSSTLTVSLQVSTCTGINSLSSSLKNVSVYPNPASSEINIELANGLQKKVELTDYTGKLVLTTSSSNDAIKLNIQTLPNGIYQLKVESNGAQETFKIVKQ